MILRNVDID